LRKGCATAALVHFNRWNNIYNEIIELPSLRLAPLNLFSSRTDIPRYNLSLEDDNMRGLVISGSIVETNHPHLIEVEQSSSEEEPFAVYNDILDIIANNQINHISNN
jgi:hypothetical protein